MTDETKNTIDDGILIEAEILSAWGPFFELKIHEIDILVNSIIFKLHQAHYHLLQAQHNSISAQKCLANPIKNHDRFYFDFVTNCNIDSMIYALNSIMDILTKFINKIYFENNNQKPEYFSDLDKNSSFLNHLKSIDPASANIIRLIVKMKERRYVNKYCNQNKHERAFFSAGSYFDVNLEKLEIIKGSNLKTKYTRDKDDRELTTFVPQIERAHREKICELGKSMLIFKGLEPFKIDDNFLKYLNMVSNRYFR